MNSIIQINYDSERPTASARGLWEFLERPYDQFTKWFGKYKEYGFTENEDYQALSTKILTAQGNSVPAQDYQLTIDMAKELCMLQKTEKGKQARTYFLDLEKQWNSPEYVMARALKMADNKILCLQSENAQQKQVIAEFSPKASYYDVVLQTKDTLSASQIAKDYGKSAQWLNEILHDKGVQYKQGEVWLLYQKHAEQGYTKSKTHTYSGNDGQQHSKLHTYWTQKGRLFIYDLLKKDGIYPLIEQEKSA